MPSGFQTFDASGNLLMDTNTRVGTFIGVTRVEQSNGSIIVPDFGLPGVIPFWMINGEQGHNMYAPKVEAGYIDGAWRLKWTFRDGYAYGYYRITYGIY